MGTVWCCMRRLVCKEIEYLTVRKCSVRDEPFRAVPHQLPAAGIMEHLDSTAPNDATACSWC